MGRTRSIDRDAILDAAERVVAWDGAANLMLDAVAREAGVSKASVLYDAKTKQAVLEAVVERAFQRDAERHAAAEADGDADDGCVVRARIRLAARPPSAAFLPVATNITAALAVDTALRERMREQQATTIQRVLGDTTTPRGTLLAYLALEGLKFLEHLDFHHFAPSERERILGDIAWLAGADPVLPTNQADG